MPDTVLTEQEIRQLLEAEQAYQRRKYQTEENPIREAGKDWLELHGCDVIRNNTRSGWLFSYVKGKRVFHVREGRFMRFGKIGSGDLLAISPYGRWIEAEAKSDGGKQSPEQIERQQRVERLRGVYVLFRSVLDLEARKRDILAPDW
jgi:hypothetical protein